MKRKERLKKGSMKSQLLQRICKGIQLLRIIRNMGANHIKIAKKGIEKPESSKIYNKLSGSSSYRYYGLLYAIIRI